jgi:hypothetical protein
MLEEWVVGNRGISSLEEFYEAEGREEEVSMFFDDLGNRKRMHFGGVPAVGDGHSTEHPSTKKPEQ